MKNQMGNNNVSGLQEEEKLSAVGAQEKLMTQEAVHEVAVNGESQMSEEVKDNDFIGKEEESSPDHAYSSGANDSRVQNQTFDHKKEKVDTVEVPTEDLIARTTDKEDTVEVPTEDLDAQTTETEDTMEVPTEDLVAQTTEIEETEEVQTKETVVQATENENGDTEEVPTANLVAQATEKEDTEEVRINDLVGQTTKKEEMEEAISEDLVSENAEFKHHNEYLEVPASSELSSCNDKPLELTSERLDFGTNGPPHSKQPLFFARVIERDELLGSNSAFDSKFIPGDDVDPKSDDQSESVGSRDEQIGDSLGAEIKENELLDLNISTHYDQKDHLTYNKAAENLPVGVMFNTSDQDVEKIVNEFIQEGNVPQEEKLSETTSTGENTFEIPQVDEDGDGLATGKVEHVFSSDLGAKGKLEMASYQEVSEAVPNKSMIHTEESKLIVKESEIGENSESSASQTKNVTTGFDCNKNGKENASDSNYSPEKESFNQIEETKMHSGASLIGSNLNSVISKNFEVDAEEVPEIRTVLTALTLVEPNQKQENSAEKVLGRISAEPNDGNQVELRKSPSFDFDLPLGARYEESDQTPLLCLDKASSRSLSSRDTLTFQNATAKNQYGRDQLPNEAAVVEEKTIRMERSDSDKPRAPFMSLLKKEGKANAFVELIKQEEAPLTDQEVVSTTSNKGSGKRKQRASLFSTCICCATSIPS